MPILALAFGLSARANTVFAQSGPLQAAWNVRTDERTRLVASCLRQLRAIKLAALEVPLATKLLASRDQELQAMRAYLNDLTKIVAISK